MKIRIAYLASLLLFITFSSCETTESCEENINEDCVCITLYDPVCGCNGVTYSNSCAAACVGVSATKGECLFDKTFILGNWSFLGYKKADKLSNDIDKKHKYEINALFTKEEDNYRISGRTAINFYGGAYFIKSNKDKKGLIDIESFIMTKIGGPEPDLSYEQKYIENLDDVDSFQLVNSNTLYLEFSKGDTRDIMIFKKSK
jgi:heat shock protein HslJ